MTADSGTAYAIVAAATGIEQGDWAEIDLALNPALLGNVVEAYNRYVATLGTSHRERLTLPTYNDFINFIDCYKLGKTPDYKKNLYKLYAPSLAATNLLNTPDMFSYASFIRSIDSAISHIFRRPMNANFPEFYRQRHTVITGGTGSGKSEIAKAWIDDYIRANLKHPRYSLVVMDPHGDLIKDITKLRSTQAYKDNVILFDPTLSDSVFPCLNPFDFPVSSNADIEALASELTGVMAEMLGSDLTTAMSTMLTACIAVLLKKGGSSLWEVLDFMKPDRAGELIQLGKDFENKAISRYFQEEFSNSNLDITKRSLTARVYKILQSSVFSATFCQRSTFSLKAALEAHKVVLINLSKGYLGSEASTLLARSIIAQLHIMAVQRQRDEKAKRTQVHAFIEEFSNCVTPSIENILTEDRKYGLALTIINQSLEYKIPGTMQSTIADNVAIKVTGKLVGSSATAKLFGADPGELSSLNVGEFIARIGHNQHFRFSARRATAFSSTATVEAFKADQIHRYYRPVAREAYRAPSPVAEFAGVDHREALERGRAADEISPPAPPLSPGPPLWTITVETPAQAENVPDAASPPARKRRKPAPDPNSAPIPTPKKPLKPLF